MELVEVQLPEAVHGAARDGKQQPRGSEARTVAIRTRALDHHLLEPGLHPRVGFTALPVPAVVALDPAGDPMEANLPSVLIVASHLCVGRRPDHDLPRVDAVKDGVADLLGKPAPRRVERKIERQRQAVHDSPVPRVRVVLVRLTDEAPAEDAAPRIGDEQLRMRELVDAKAAARPAGALGVVEDEVLGRDVAVHEMMRGAAHVLVEPLRLRFAGASRHMHLEQSVSDQQRGRNAGPDRLLVLPADDESIDDGRHVRGRGSHTVPDQLLHGLAGLRRRPLGHLHDVRRDLGGDVHLFAVDDHSPAALLAHLREYEVELFAVDGKHRRPQLDLGAFGQRQDGFEDLARRPARRRFPGPRTMRLADRRVEQIQIARDVRHRADGRSRIARHRLLLDRDHGREAEHEIDVRLLDLGDEAFRETGQRFHVPPLAFRVDRVEGQAGLARTGEAGDDREAVARNLDRDVFQVVHARALNGHRGAGGFTRASRAAGRRTLRLHRDAIVLETAFSDLL